MDVSDVEIATIAAIFTCKVDVVCMALHLGFTSDEITNIFKVTPNYKTAARQILKRINKHPISRTAKLRWLFDIAADNYMPNVTPTLAVILERDFAARRRQCVTLSPFS